MPRVSNIELLNQIEQPTISIRTRTAVQNLPEMIGSSYHRLGTYLGELGEHLGGMPFVAYYNMDMQNLDVEIGFPVASVLPDNGDIRSGMMPAGKRIFCMYRGPYQELAQVYDEMQKWLVEKGIEPSGIVYEHYWNSPEFGQDDLLTEIVMPVK